jgi:hypothetical protein
LLVPDQLSYIGRLKVKEWFKKRHSEHWAAAPCTGMLKLLLEEPFKKPSWDLLAFDRKHCRLVHGC